MRIPWPTGRAEDILQRAVVLVLSLSLAGLIGLAIVAFVSSQDTAKRALETRDLTAASASRRITSLQLDLADARDQIAVLHGQNAESNTKLDAVLAQLRQLNVTPVVTSSGVGAALSTPTTAPRRRTTPATTTTTAPPGPAGTSPPTTQPTPDPGPGAPPPPTQPAPPGCRLLAVPVICP